MNKKQTGFNLAYVLIAVAGVLILQDFWIRQQAVATIPYSEFQKLVREDKIANVVVGQDRLSGEFKEAIGGEKGVPPGPGGPAIPEGIRPTNGGDPAGARTTTLERPPPP